MKLKVRRVITTKKYYMDEVDFVPGIDYLGDVDVDLKLSKETVVDDNTTVWDAETMEIYEDYGKGNY